MSNIEEVKTHGTKVIAVLNNTQIFWEVFCDEIIKITMAHRGINPIISKILLQLSSITSAFCGDAMLIVPAIW
jgi:glucosamine 6-phosphate synthetase-like amidotransferase/phosphosugar isomerase protein